MKRIEALAVVAGIVLLAGCGGGGGGGGSTTSGYNCSLACLKSTPTVATSTGTSTVAAGDTVTVTLQLTGSSYAGLDHIHVSLDDINFDSTTSIGDGFADIPLTGSTVDVTITVAAAPVPGTYYPYIYLGQKGKVDVNYGITNMSSAKYFFAETTDGGITHTEADSPFDVPTIHVAAP